MREREWLKDSWSASANASERGKGTAVEVTTGVEVRAGVELPDWCSAVFVVVMTAKETTQLCSWFMTCTHTQMRADMHVNIFACICVFKMNFLCLYFVTLCSCICFFSVAVCKMPNCKCALWIITALLAHYFGFGFGFIPTHYISVSFFSPFGWHFREIWPQCVTS